MNVNRIIRFDETQHLPIKVNAEMGMKPALQKNLRSAKIEGFPDFLAEGILCDDEGIRMLRRPEIRAEFASADTAIGVVDVAVHHKGDHRIGMQSFSDFMGQISKIEQVGPFQQILGFCGIDTAIAKNFAVDGGDFEDVRQSLISSPQRGEVGRGAIVCVQGVTLLQFSSRGKGSEQRLRIGIVVHSWTGGVTGR